MGRAATGTLLPPGKNGIWRGQVTKRQADGTTTRPVYSLGTTDKAHARRVLAKLAAAISAGDELPDAAAGVDTAIRVRDFAADWLAKREAQGVGMVRHERRNFELYVFDAIGHLPVCDVRPSHVRGILDHALAKGLRRNTLAHIRGVLHRLFRAALEAEIIEHNPCAAVRTPRTRETRKERMILTDDEIARFVACERVDLELRMLSLVARCEGGMRTGDLHKWDWTMIDRDDFAECFIPRNKTRAPQRLAIPPVLAPFLRAWWERAGKPTVGPVFPTRTGKNAGKHKRPENSYAKRLRRDLFRAGIYRMPPVDVPASKPGTRTDLGFKAEGTKLAPHPLDALYFETATTLPVDFHSFRRAFNTALAEAGVNVQHAMHLAAHADPKVHARYVMHTARMREIPAAALPKLPDIATARCDSIPGEGEAGGNHAERECRGRESNPRPGAYETGEVGPHCESLRDVEPHAPAGIASHEPPCFRVLADESQRIATADVKRVLQARGEGGDAVEAALARALDAAAAAGRFDVVAQLARELEARRLSRGDGKVIALDAARKDNKR
jgi:integrase